MTFKVKEGPIGSQLSYLMVSRARAGPTIGGREGKGGREQTDDVALARGEILQLKYYSEAKSSGCNRHLHFGLRFVCCEKATGLSITLKCLLSGGNIK